MQCTLLKKQTRPLASLAPQVLCTLLKAHVAAYKELKALPGGQEACIGMVHQHVRFVPKSGCTPHIA